MSEPVQYANRKGDCYTLFEGRTKTGKPKYFVSRRPSSSGEPIDRIPDGYEIYENPNANVTVRRVQPREITDDEYALVKRLVEQNGHIDFAKVEIERKHIVIYTAENKLDEFAERFVPPWRTPEEIRATEYRFAHFSGMLRFTLNEKNSRRFCAERFCFLGSIDRWIHLAGPAVLSVLAEKCIPHLGQQSFYELGGFDD